MGPSSPLCCPRGLHRPQPNLQQLPILSVFTKSAIQCSISYRLLQVMLIHFYVNFTIISLGNAPYALWKSAFMDWSFLCMVCHHLHFVTTSKWEQWGRPCLKKLITVVSGSEALCTQFFCKMTWGDARKASKLHFICYGVEGMLGSLDCMLIF